MRADNYNAYFTNKKMNYTLFDKFKEALRFPLKLVLH